MRRQELHPRTAVINKAQKNQSKIARNKALTWLAATFPEAFNTTTRIRPLKINIIQDIFDYLKTEPASDISLSKIREALVVFTRRLDYLACLKARESRIDLLGNPIAAVTAEDAEKAAQKIKKRIEKNTKNASKSQLDTSHSSTLKLSYSPVNRANSVESDPHYIERPPMFSSQSTTVSASKVSATTIKHKSARQFDPDAVARLKEKLGLSRQTKELVE